MPRERTDFSKKLHDIPHKPGVYVMRDRLGRVIYVGKARDLRKRLANYFVPSRYPKLDLKTRALVDTVWDFEWHIVKSEPEALLFEGKLIKEYRPKYNISFRDDKRFLMVKVNFAEELPRFQLTRLKKDDGAKYFGPYPHGPALRSTLETLKKRFGLRSCRVARPGEKDYKHCLDHVIKNCSAPCIGKISHAEYRARVVQACEFLEGSSREMIESVEAEMKAAAEKLNFEKASQLRNLLEDLKRTSKPMTRFTRKSLPSTIDPETDLKALGDALALAAAPQIMECFDISNITSTHIVASMVRFKNGTPDRSSYRKYRIKTVKGQDDFASMGEVVRRRYSGILREAHARNNTPEMQDEIEVSQESPLDAARKAGATFPDLIIVDGGRGQLSSACRELQKLGLHELAIIGLAKEFEEIYRPSRPLPLQLPEDSGALKLLQRIRDEAHRFANNYHSLLLKKRVSESLLDDIPGVSEQRKKQLLKKFGSVERLRKAGIEDIAQTPGVSNRLAEDISRYLVKKPKAKIT
ncbi:MAG: excinuclease ABC subunit UvrC [Chthoniobacterales bacterium]